MKTRFLALIFLSSVLAVSCSKEKEEPMPEPEPESPGVGFWKGTYKPLGFTTYGNAALLAKEDGILRYYEMGNLTDTIDLPDGYKLSGTWYVEDGNFKLSLLVGAYFASANLKINATGKSMIGPYKIDGDLVGTMTFEK